MDYDLSDEQSLFLDSLERILERARVRSLGEVFFHYDEDLAGELEREGYLAVGREPGASIEAALLVESVARLRQVIEVGATVLVAPALGLDQRGPIALSSAEELGGAIRFLPVAQALLFDDGDRALLLAVESGDVEEVETVFGYPVGRLRDRSVLSRARDLGPGSGDLYRRRRRLSFALEACGAARAALDETVRYVKERRQFGRAIGSFQTVQHRLAECATTIEGARWLALNAAWTGSSSDAALAAAHIHAEIGRLAWDLHCFNGAQSWTLSYPLHFRTFRLRMLQGEIGGAEAQGVAAGLETWGE